MEQRRGGRSAWWAMAMSRRFWEGSWDFLESPLGGSCGSLEIKDSSLAWLVHSSDWYLSSSSSVEIRRTFEHGSNTYNAQTLSGRRNRRRRTLRSDVLCWDSPKIPMRLEVASIGRAWEVYFFLSNEMLLVFQPKSLLRWGPRPRLASRRAKNEEGWGSWSQKTLILFRQALFFWVGSLVLIQKCGPY